MNDTLKMRVNDFWEVQAEAVSEGKDAAFPDEIVSLMVDMTDCIAELEIRLRRKSKTNHGFKERLEVLWTKQEEAQFDETKTGAPTALLELMVDLTDYIDKLEARVKERAMRNLMTMRNLVKRRLDEFWAEQDEADFFDGEETGVPPEVVLLMADMTDYIDKLEARVKETSDA